MEDSIQIIDDDTSTDESILQPRSPVLAAVPQSVTPRVSDNQWPGPVPVNSDSTQGSPVVSSTKKRKRAIFTPSPKSQKSDKTSSGPIFEDDDDGSTCPICLDHWEMSGDHRLTSLKCGHLFGQSCIRRWLQECVTGAKCCPSCKAKATPRDFRYLYAKKLCALDNTELEALKVLLEEKRVDYLKLNTDKNIVEFELQHHRQRVLQLQDENDYLRRRISNPSTSDGSGGAQHQPPSSQQARDAALERLMRLKKVKLFLEKNIEISREAGCRCMVSSKSDRLLFVSQKSSQSLFPGYGLRSIDLETLKPTNFVHVSAKQIRDLVVTDYPDSQPNYLLTATMETSGRLYDVTGRSHLLSFKPTMSNNGQPEEQLWCCAFGATDHMWFGGQRGTVYQFDKRQPTQQRTEINSPGDNSPVINVAYVPPIPGVLTFGGLLICKLKEVSFLQFIDEHSHTTHKIAINVEGPFSSMSYDVMTGFVLIQTRCGKTPSRYVMGRFAKAAVSGSVALVVKHTFLGSDVMPVVSRPVQYHVSGTDSVLMTAYLQSTKMLTTWAVANNLKLQAMSVTDTILDLCPVYLRGVRHLAALTDSKCRIFKIHEERL